MTKNEILARLAESREKLLATIDGLSEQEMTQPGVNGDWSIKDILVHLTRWEAELVKLLWQAMQGMKPSTLHFSHIEVDEINQRWYEESSSRPLDLAMQDFHGVRKQTIRRVKDLTDKLLTELKAYPWLEGQPLWEWIAGDSFEHETEHVEAVVAWRKNRGGVE
jgi:hypothetical protein